MVGVEFMASGTVRVRVRGAVPAGTGMIGFEKRPSCGVSNYDEVRRGRAAVLPRITRGIKLILDIHRHEITHTRSESGEINREQRRMPW